MKVKVLHLDPSQYTVKRAGDRVPIVRNPLANMSSQTPNHKQREYVRALTAAKMDRMFAKPFLSCLDGHVDSVEVISRSRNLLAPILTGGADGCVNFWDLPAKRCLVSIKKAHEGFVRGIVMSNDSRIVYSVGSDKRIRAWKFNPDTFVTDQEDVDSNILDEDQGLLVKSIDWSSGFSSVDHHWSKQTEIATACASTVDVWDVFKSNSPIQSYQWGDASVLSCKFNPSETNLLVTTMSDNSVGLFDTRASSGIQKIFLKNRSNAVCWNPRDPFVFAIANDDGNLYQMDMRRVGSKSPHASPIVRMHTGHVQGVTSVDVSPLGTEIVSGGYDKTVRIFDLKSQKSREIYHNRRMQRVLSVSFSGDGRFVLSGSEDTNMRVWKAVASEKIGVVQGREKRAIEYRNKLKDKYGRVEEVGRILHHRHVPKWIKNEGKRRADHFESQRIVEKNKAATSNQSVQHNLVKAVRRVEQ